jgi:hypothetical protein
VLSKLGTNQELFYKKEITPLHLRLFRQEPTRSPLACLTVFLLCTAAASAATISGNVADYNAAEVRLTSGVVTVPANLATYTASATLAIGSTFVVTLPTGFSFGSAPALATSGSATFSLTSGGTGQRSATFTVATAVVAPADTISFATFSVAGATALETVTPVAHALPVTMQAIGTDSAPLSFGAFASDTGLYAVFVGAIQFIDVTPPSNSTKFGTGVSDSLTAVISATALSKQAVDAATSSVAILSPNGTPNSLSVGDTGTITMGGDFGGIARVFSSSTSDCLHPLVNGTVNYSSVSVPGVPLNVEVFFCMTGSGSPLQPTPNGFTQVTISPGTSSDFLSTAVINEFPGEICFSTGCAPFTQPSSVLSVPTLSDIGMGILAGAIAFLGLWRLKPRRPVLT